jgi:hypothetical protein
MELVEIFLYSHLKVEIYCNRWPPSVIMIRPLSIRAAMPEQSLSGMAHR